MNIYFWKNGTWSYLPQYDSELAFRKMPIGTEMKGPLYTFIDKNAFSQNETIDATIDISFCKDLPFDGGRFVHSTMYIDSLQSLSNCYPLVKQLMYADEFLQQYSVQYYKECSIFLDKIDLTIGNKQYTFDETVDDLKIIHVFEKYGLATSVHSVAHPWSGFLVRKCGIWREFDFHDRKDILDEKWSEIMIPIHEIESVYSFTRSQYERLDRIDSLAIQVIYTESDDDDIRDINFSDDAYIGYAGYDLMDALWICLYVPQILYMEKCLYNSKLTLQITIIEKDDRDLHLVITSKEFDRYKGRLCLIDIILNMLKM